MKSQYTFPTVHLNGTSRKELLEGYHAAYRALEDAMEALNETTFHARDYYVNPDPRAWLQAYSERQGQWTKLREVLSYLEDHVKHLS